MSRMNRALDELAAASERVCRECCGDPCWRCLVSLSHERRHDWGAIVVVMVAVVVLMETKSHFYIKPRMQFVQT